MISLMNPFEFVIGASLFLGGIVCIDTGILYMSTDPLVAFPVVLGGTFATVVGIMVLTLTGCVSRQ